jgi:hypothetical protein
MPQSESMTKLLLHFSVCLFLNFVPMVVETLEIDINCSWFVKWIHLFPFGQDESLLPKLLYDIKTLLKQCYQNKKVK